MLLETRNLNGGCTKNIKNPKAFENRLYSFESLFLHNFTQGLGQLHSTYKFHATLLFPDSILHVSRVFAELVLRTGNVLLRRLINNDQYLKIKEKMGYLQRF